ncbi:MAG: aldehyde dehydrogenase family protein [Bdellovibrionales bacterium]|nr:aldehyde dehydrogenase family protein [Bdellovibrionales bacterium]
MENIEVKNPFSGNIVNTYPVQNLEQVRERILLSQQAQKTWSKVSLTERVNLVQKALSYFEDHREDIARDISLQMGRPFSQAKGEISGLLDRANYLCSIAEKTLADDVIEDSENFYRAIQHVPLGVIFIISAWNYPLLITINGVIPALLAGNAVILKHSSTTPAIGQHFEKALSQLGDHSPLLQSIVVGHETTGKIIEDLPIHHLIFTGSVKGGREILKHAAKKFMMPQLELGGKDGAYVAADADIKNAAATIVDGAMFNSGQSCCGIERVYVHEKVYDDFLNEALELVKQYRLGDPLQETTNLGPVAHAHSIDFMLEQIQEATSKGAKVLFGGKDEIIQQGRFLQPTLLVDVDHTMDIVKEENFGPILPIIKVKGDEEAFTFINDSDYGLTCAIFTQDQELAKKFSEQAETGTVFMNRCDYLDPALPWTGVKNSGVGSGLSKYSFYGVTRRKSIHFKK